MISFFFNQGTAAIIEELILDFLRLVFVVNQQAENRSNQPCPEM